MMKTKRTQAWMITANGLWAQSSNCTTQNPHELHSPIGANVNGSVSQSGRISHQRAQLKTEHPQFTWIHKRGRISNKSALNVGFGAGSFKSRKFPRARKENGPCKKDPCSITMLSSPIHRSEHHAFCGMAFGYLKFEEMTEKRKLRNEACSSSDDDRGKQDFKQSHPESRIAPIHPSIHLSFGTHTAGLPPQAVPSRSSHLGVLKPEGQWARAYPRARTPCDAH